MLITLLGIVTFVKLLQPSKAKCPMLTTLFGNVTCVRFVQSMKAPPLITVTVSGMHISVISQYANAPIPMVVIPESIWMRSIFIEASEAAVFQGGVLLSQYTPGSTVP